jgi:glycosyltransferase involved in cell wall biosynthesis
MVIRNSDFIVYISDWLRNQYLTEGIQGIRQKPYRIVHHAPDSFFLNGTPGYDVKNQDFRQSNHINLCCATRFSLWDKSRGLFLLYDALQLLKQNNPEVELHTCIAGDGKFAAHFQKIKENLPINDLVTFTGRLEKDDLRELYIKSDLFVYPSFQDGCPTVVLEAQACGVPVIVTRSSGGAELVKSQETGMICNPDAHDLARAILELAMNSAKFKVLFIQSRKHILSNLSWEVCGAEFNNIIESM